MPRWRPAPKFAIGAAVYPLRLNLGEGAIVKHCQWSEALHEWRYQLVGEAGWHRQSELVLYAAWQQLLQGELTD